MRIEKGKVWVELIVDMKNAEWNAKQDQMEQQFWHGVEILGVHFEQFCDDVRIIFRVEERELEEFMALMNQGELI
jgi:hypothetical protein